MKRTLVALGAVVLLIGIIGVPADAAPKPEFATVTGDLTFVETDTEPPTTVHAVFEMQRIWGDDGVMVPNGSVTVAIGDEGPLTFTPHGMEAAAFYDPGEEWGSPMYDLANLYGPPGATDLGLMLHTDATGVQHAAFYSYTDSNFDYSYSGAVASGQYTLFLPKEAKAPKRTPFVMTVDVTGPNVAPGAPAEFTGTVTGKPFDGASVTISVDSLTPGATLRTTYVFNHPKGSVTAQGYSRATSGTAECPGDHFIEAGETGWADGTGTYAGTRGEISGPIGCLTFDAGQLTLHGQLVGSYERYSVEEPSAPKTTTERLALALVGSTESMLSPIVTGTMTGRPNAFDGSTMRLTASAVSLTAPFTTTYLLTLAGGDTVSATGSATASLDLLCGPANSYRILDSVTVTGGTGGYATATGTLALDGCLTPPASGSGDPYGFTAQLTGVVTH